MGGRGELPPFSSSGLDVLVAEGNTQCLISEGKRLFFWAETK